MLISKEILNCGAGAVIKIDTSKESTQRALVENKLKFNCRIAGSPVKLDTTELFGNPINVICLNDKCRFYKKV